METGPLFIIPFDRLEKPGIELATPGLQGDLTTTVSRRLLISLNFLRNSHIISNATALITLGLVMVFTGKAIAVIMAYL